MIQVLTNSVVSAVKSKIDHRKSSIESKLRHLKKVECRLDFGCDEPPQISDIIKLCVGDTLNRVPVLTETTIDLEDFVKSCKLISFSVAGSGKGRIAFNMPTEKVKKHLMPILLVEHECAKERLQALRKKRVAEGRKALSPFKGKGYIVEVVYEGDSGLHVYPLGGRGIQRNLRVAFPKALRIRNTHYKVENLIPVMKSGRRSFYRVSGRIERISI